MKSWRGLAEILFGIFAGYLIGIVMQQITLNSTFILAALALSGNHGFTLSVFLSSLMAWGVFLIGVAIAIVLGIIGNGALLMFLPLAGVISTLISVVMELYLLFKILVEVSFPFFS